MGPSEAAITYLETLFEAGENVGYVVKSHQAEDGRWKPTDKGLI